MKHKLSSTSTLHYVKLVVRSFLLIGALIVYIISKVNHENFLFEDLTKLSWVLVTIWVLYFIEMFLRFFPSKLESPGCQKQFAENYKPIENTKPENQSWKRTFFVFLSWIILNAIIGILYYINIIDVGILVLISLAYGVCDMICILFFCPFQTLIMKNRCCTTCRIYNWDFAMMFTPYIFTPGLYTWSLLGFSLLLLLKWEIAYRLYPERFSTKTNDYIQCKNCTEKLCQHKKQLRSFIRKYRDIFFDKKNN
jgi:hypothetical protein